MTYDNTNIQFSEKLKSYSSEQGKYGDWVPDVVKKILIKDKRLDLIACVILSKICYWYTLRKNGKKKYAGSELKLSITDLSKQTYLSYKQTKGALERLEKKYKYIRRTNTGKLTYVSLNTEIIEKAITLHEPLWADKIGLTSPTGPIHIHKEPQKLNFRNERSKIQDTITEVLKMEMKITNVEEIVDDKNNQIEDCFMPYSTFVSMCNNTAAAFNTKIKCGMTPDDLLKHYLYDANSNSVHPAYTKLLYLYEGFRDDWDALVRFSTASAYTTEFERLLYQVRIDCTTVPDIHDHILTSISDEQARLYLTEALSVDVDKAKRLVREKVKKLKSEKANMANRLELYCADLKNLKIGDN